MRKKRREIIPRKKKPEKITIREKVSNILDLPKEVALDNPRLIMIGRKKLVIENYKGISGYDSDCVRIKTSIGRVKITGAGLTISEVTSEDILVEGLISQMQFEDAFASRNQQLSTEEPEDY